MKNITVLIVDDDNEVLTVLSEIIHELKFKSVSATNGVEAMQLIKTQQIDLIITDLIMPKMDGLTLIQQSRSLNPRIPIAVISGHGEARNVTVALNRGAYNFITKPFAIRELEAIVKKGLRLREVSLGTLKLLEGVRNYTEMTIPSNPHLLPSATLYIERECQWRGIEDGDLLSNISICVDELLSNALIHGNKMDETKKIVIKLTFDQKKLMVSIEDEGGGFNHYKELLELKEDSHTLPTKRGLFITNYLMDELSFNKEGNLVTVIKYLQEEGEHAQLRDKV